VNPALVLGAEELWVAAGGALLLFPRDSSDAPPSPPAQGEENDGSEAEREQAGP
jgi:hypothetical protein